ncbi:hypothetical protein [Nocardia stercoris]|uniref:Uncharacterized protein n=1 Tax=Nocardia stercoris TaxID=2483361 RepID=A0A3M2L4T6_9NOCA|nr:hypothetical protein [Nocardia stercoris]RMI32679.1 hypothetical protein EBN03_11980 [Nocardia stercoris]
MSELDDFEHTDSWNIAIPTDDDSITRRRRALAPIQILTDLERTKSSLDGDFWANYDLFRIALAVIDQVALAMGLSSGRTWDETLVYATEQAGRQVPDADPREWAKVAERVVVSLVTIDVEVVRHLVHTADGPTWRQQRFRLLYLHPDSTDGLEHLRASEQAINIFVDALDLDIEAAQIANEAQMAALIERGAVASAVQIARVARYRSIEYQERIRRVVADTLIDPDTHDWLGDVPAYLNAALDHVRGRLDAETTLLETVDERRSAITDRTQLDAVNRLLEILRECRYRHSELHRHLIGARGALRQALDDRFARPPRRTHRTDLGADLLVPLLAGPTQRAARAADRLLAAAGGLHVRWWPSLTTMTDELCTPPRTPELGAEYEPPEIDSVDTPEWWDAYEDVAEALLAGLSEPVRLSQLLARIEHTAETDATELDTDEGQTLDPSILAATVVHTAHHAWAPHLAGRSAGDRLVVAVATGKTLDSNMIRSEDLLLIPAELSADIAVPTSKAQVPNRIDDRQEGPE